MATHDMISRHMRGATKDQVIRRRDAAGHEMNELARIMNEPNPSAEEVISYLRELARKLHVSPHEAALIIRTVPHDPNALRGWARQMFSFVMHQGIHAHAAYPKELYPSPDSQEQQQAPTAPTNDGTPTIQ